MASVFCSSGANKTTVPSLPKKRKQEQHLTENGSDTNESLHRLIRESLSCVLLVIKGEINDDANVALLQLMKYYKWR